MKAGEAWGDFHERSFRFFGGVFANLIYDNDSVLVKHVLGSEHHQTDFSHALEEHYGFQSRFCNVGAGNEKVLLRTLLVFVAAIIYPVCRRFQAGVTPTIFLRPVAGKKLPQANTIELRNLSRIC